MLTSLMMQIVIKEMQNAVKLSLPPLWMIYMIHLCYIV